MKVISNDKVNQREIKDGDIAIATFSGAAFILRDVAMDSDEKGTRYTWLGISPGTNRWDGYGTRDAQIKIALHEEENGRLTIYRQDEYELHLIKKEEDE